MTALTWIRCTHALTREVRTFAAELPLPPGWVPCDLVRDVVRCVEATRSMPSRAVVARVRHVVARDAGASS